MHERPGYPPFPDYSSHHVIATRLTGPKSFTHALDMQEWIRNLLSAGFTADGVGPETSGASCTLELTDPGGRVRVILEYGGCWGPRTALNRVASEDGDASCWWASCQGLMPSTAVIAVAAVAGVEAGSGDLLEGAGWERVSRYLASDGVTVALETWSAPGGGRSAARREDGTDCGWLLSYEDLRRVTEITASLETPAGVLVALAEADA